MILSPPIFGLLAKHSKNLFSNSGSNCALCRAEAMKLIGSSFPDWMRAIPARIRSSEIPASRMLRMGLFYRRLKSRLGGKGAVTATAHKLACLV